MTSLLLLALRAVVGGLLAGHGAQKLFGWFGGNGLEGTAGWLRSMRLEPSRRWALIAGVSEFGGGLLTVLGLLNPLGPIAATAAMLTAWLKVHLGKPIWNSAGGAELPLVNLTVLSVIALRGPGRLSLDGLFRIRVPRGLGLIALVSAVVGVVVASRAELEDLLLLSEDVVEAAPDDVDAGAKVLDVGNVEENEPTADGQDVDVDVDGFAPSVVDVAAVEPTRT
jgi:putative oxidoreductase